MADGRPHFRGSAVPENFRGGDQGAGRLGDVVDQQHFAALHFTDYADGLDRRGALAFLRHQREGRAHRIRVG